MGKFFVDSQDVVRIDFEDGEWIEVKEELSQADQDYLLNAMAKAIANGGKPKVEMKLGKMALLERSIVNWSFKDGEKSIPVTSENISNLRLRYRETILKTVDDLAEKASAYVLKNAKRASI